MMIWDVRVQTWFKRTSNDSFCHHPPSLPPCGGCRWYIAPRTYVLHTYRHVATYTGTHCWLDDLADGMDALKNTFFTVKTFFPFKVRGAANAPWIRTDMCIHELLDLADPFFSLDRACTRFGHSCYMLGYFKHPSLTHSLSPSFKGFMAMLYV